MLVERLLRSTLGKRIKEAGLEKGWYTVFIRRKHPLNRLRSHILLAMPVCVVKVDNYINAYIDNKEMTLPGWEEEVNGEIIHHKGVTMKWDKWTDMFISMKAMDRVMNNKFSKTMRIIELGEDEYSFMRLNKILRHNFDKFELLFEELDSNTIEMLNTDKCSFKRIG